MKTQFLCFSLILTVLLYGCSSTEPELRVEDNTETIQRDYIVRGASSNIKPQWIEDAGRWATKSKQDVKKFRYFSYETTPKVDRQIACSLAKTNVRVDIASEVATFIQKTLGSSKEGQAAINENDPQLEEMREFVENTLAEKVQGMIHGASVERTYWEKRKYRKKMGAKRDFTGYTCAALIKIEADRLRAAVDNASKLVVNKVSQPEAKAKVQKALDKVTEDFLRARQGLI